MVSPSDEETAMLLDLADTDLRTVLDTNVGSAGATNVPAVPLVFGGGTSGIVAGSFAIGIFFPLPVCSDGFGDWDAYVTEPLSTVCDNPIGLSFTGN